MKHFTLIISLTVVLLADNFAYGQSLQNPVKINNKSYHYIQKKKLVSTATPTEGKEFTVPNNAIWYVNVNCKYCYLRLTKKTTYVSVDTGYSEETDGNIALALMPVVLYPGTTFVLASVMLNGTDNLFIEEYKSK